MPQNALDFQQLRTAREQAPRQAMAKGVLRHSARQTRRFSEPSGVVQMDLACRFYLDPVG